MIGRGLGWWKKQTRRVNHTSLRERRSHVSSPKVVGAMSRLVGRWTLIPRLCPRGGREEYESTYDTILRSSLLTIGFESLINRRTRWRKVLSRAAMSQMLLVAASAAPDNFKPRSRDNPARSLPLVESIMSNVRRFTPKECHARARAHRSTKPPYLILLRNWNHATRGRTFSNCVALSRCLRRAGGAIKSNVSKAEIRMK